jgi:hypothetical protein
VSVESERGLPSLDEAQDGSIEAGLLLLSMVTPRGVELTQTEIAHVCGCSRGLIYLIEKSAVHKLRRQEHRFGEHLTSREERPAAVPSDAV